MSARPKKPKPRPSLPMTLRQHERTRDASRDRCNEIEIKLVARAGDDPLGSLPELAAFAAEALKQRDLALEALPENANPFIWPIFSKERELLAELQQRHPADSKMLLRILDLLRQYSEEATVDELALGAIKGLEWTAIRAGQISPGGIQ